MYVMYVMLCLEKKKFFPYFFSSILKCNPLNNKLFKEKFFFLTGGFFDWVIYVCMYVCLPKKPAKKNRECM